MHKEFEIIIKCMFIEWENAFDFGKNNACGITVWISECSYISTNYNVGFLSNLNFSGK